MSVRMIITAVISDREKFLQAYAKPAAALVEKYGGRYKAIGREAQLLEGEWGEGASVLVSEWPNREAAYAFWTSDEYEKLKAHRHGIAQVQVLMIDMQDLDQSSS
ncbi:MAG TPA: DUF1330 domain-containing protein [Hellea balneolensis]|uniref:DUF1330 domain-containing protein n=1 Tax=Hellea balneolensis TaxID=287478 RepID=A0A7C5M0E2_9PROT|nr:DUF1330 domain-containing protein [Hellea balneolensis]